MNYDTVQLLICQIITALYYRLCVCFVVRAGLIIQVLVTMKLKSCVLTKVRDEKKHLATFVCKVELLLHSNCYDYAVLKSYAIIINNNSTLPIPYVCFLGQFNY